MQLEANQALCARIEQKTTVSTLYYLLPGFLLNKKPGVRQPQRIEKARLLIANTPMDTDKIKVFGSRVKVDSIAKVAELELAEKEKMKEKVSWLFELPALLRESF